MSKAISRLVATILYILLTVMQSSVLQNKANRHIYSPKEKLELDPVNVNFFL